MKLIPRLCLAAAADAAARFFPFHFQVFSSGQHESHLFIELASGGAFFSKWMAGETYSKAAREISMDC